MRMFVGQIQVDTFTKPSMSLHPKLDGVGPICICLPRLHDASTTMEAGESGTLTFG